MPQHSFFLFTCIITIYYFIIYYDFYITTMQKNDSIVYMIGNKYIFFILF